MLSAIRLASRAFNSGEARASTKALFRRWVVSGESFAGPKRPNQVLISKRPRPSDLREAQGNGTAIVAFNKKTGVEKYRIGDELASYSSPVVMTIGERRDLREMGDAQNLMEARELFQFAANHLGDRATDSGVHLVEDHQRLRRGAATRQRGFQRQGQTGEFAA